MNTHNLPEYEIINIFSRMLDCRVNSLERIGGGSNNRVYKLTCENSNIYIGKRYFRHGMDDRDRLGVEFAGLSYLWKHGIRRIPQPMAFENGGTCAAYEYVDGDPIKPQDVTGDDIDGAVEFLGQLKELKSKEGSRSLVPASEACFSMRSLVENMTMRLQKLQSLPEYRGPYALLHDFLGNELQPEFENTVRQCMLDLGYVGMSYETEIPFEERTLSPSDFGFHNALRKHDGPIVFIDFEYFGWDDPAKTVSDFLLHPGMNLENDLKVRFAGKFFKRFEDFEKLPGRFRIVYPLYVFKWCTILLNEFIPEHLERRGFARGSDFDKSKILKRQLEKSRTMLHTNLKHNEDFPYEAIFRQ